MKLLELIRSALVEVKIDEVTSIQAQNCTSFERLMEVYRQDMSVTQSLADCMAVGLAAHIAVAIEGDPLWFYLVGAPSSGKSTICELLCADEMHSMAISSLTGIVSGDRKGKHLIPMMQGRFVVIKDGTLLLESNPMQLASVFGELRDIFDGSLVKHFRNGVSASFNNIAFGMMIGITERVYSLNMASLGERFLHCRLETSRDIEEQRNKNAITSIFTTSSRTNFEGNGVGDARGFPIQKAHTAGFLSYLHAKLRSENIIRPAHTQSDINLIQALADMIACSRAQAPRSKEFGSNELLYDARPEASTRVVKQLSRLALCLCYVFGVTRITHQIRCLITKVSLDTAYSRQYNILRTIVTSAGGLTRTSLAMLVNIPLETISRRIDDLISLGIVIPESTENRPSRGRSVPTLHCAEWIRDAFLLVENHIENRNEYEDGQDTLITKPEPNRSSIRPQPKRPNKRTVSNT